MCSSTLVCDAIDEFNLVNEESHKYSFPVIQNTIHIEGVQCTVCLEEKKNTVGTSLSRGIVQASRAGSDALRSVNNYRLQEDWHHSKIILYVTNENDTGWVAIDYGFILISANTKFFDA